MVKRIKKRIPKQAEPEETVETEEIHEGIEAELEEAATEDEFTEKTAKFFGWLVDHKVAVLGTTAFVVVAMIGVSLFQSQQRAANEEAAAVFNEASEAYLETFPKPVARGETPKPIADDEKAKMVEAARVKFAAAKSSQGDRPVAQLATLGLAGTMLDQAKPEEALKLYDEVLSGELDPFTRGIALQGKAAAQESKGDLTGAANTWSKVSGVDKKAFGLAAQVQVGRLLEAQGKVSEALTHYKALTKDYSAALKLISNRTIKQSIEGRITRLGEPS